MSMNSKVICAPMEISNTSSSALQTPTPLSVPFSIRLLLAITASQWLEWFHQQWPDYNLPFTDAKHLVLQCLKSLQGTRDAGRRWYHLLTGQFLELGMVCSIADHGNFSWNWNHETSFTALETDDLLITSTTCCPFLYLKGELEKLFDLKSSEGSILHFLNLWLVQSPLGISMDQTNHIQSKILHNYFDGIPTISIPKNTVPFSFGCLLQTAALRSSTSHR